MVCTEGGCCDCGDVQAWRPTGFCSVHSGASAEDDDPAEGMPPRLKTNMLVLVGAVTHRILTYCAHLRIGKGNKKTQIRFVCVLISWLTEVVSCGDGIRRAVGLYLTSTSGRIPGDGPRLAEELGLDLERQSHGISWLAWMLALDGVDNMPEPIQEKLHEMYFQLITDLVFKREFLFKFVDNYERYLHAQVVRKRKNYSNGSDDEKQPGTDIVANFTVQLFTVPALVPVMIRQGGLLDILIDMLGTLFETCASPVAIYGERVPFEESSFANEYQLQLRRQKQMSEPVASSSSSPRQTIGRKQHHLPLPFATRDTMDNKFFRRARTRSRSDQLLHVPRATASIESMQEMTEDAESESIAPSPASAAGASFHSPAEQTEAQSSGTDEPRHTAVLPVAGNARADDEHESPHVFIAMEIQEDDVEISRDPDTEDAVLVYVGEGAVGLEEDTDGDGEVGETFNVPRTIEAILNFETAEGGATFTDRSRKNFYRMVNEPHVKEQLTVLEEGMHFTVPKNARLGISADTGPVDSSHTPSSTPRAARRSSRARRRLPARPTRPSPYLAAVREARRMARDAVRGTGALAHPMRLDWPYKQEKVMDWVKWRVKYDLKYILTHRAVAFHLMHHRRDLFRKFVRVISMAQGMHPLPRRFGDHIPLEQNSWTKPFTIEIELVYHYVELLSEAFCGSHTPQSPSSCTVPQTAQDVDLVSSRLQCIAVVRSCLDEWIERENALEARSTYSGESFSISHSVSVHLPLHRLLSFMVFHVLRLDGTSLRAALSGGVGEASVDDARRLLKHPLRVQAFLAQVRAGMWRRNGNAVAGQSMWYRSTHFSEWFIDLDLFIQQCCAAITGPDIYIQDLLEAFRIADFSKAIDIPEISTQEETSQATDTRNPSQVPTRVHTVVSSRSLENPRKRAATIDRSAKQLGLYALAPRTHDGTGRFPEDAVRGTGNTLSELAGFLPTILEDVLSHLVRIMSERSRCGLGEADFLRRKLVHQLCSGRKSHSELYKACSFRISMELDSDEDSADSDTNRDKTYSLVESILPQIADYIQPRGLEQGKYRLKDSIWDEFDPFCPHMSLRDKHAAEIRYGTACGRQNRGRQVIPTDNVHERAIFPQLRDILAFSLATTRNSGLVTELLTKVLPRNGGSRYLEGCLPAALDLVCAAAEMPSAGRERFQGGHWLYACTDDNYLKNGALSAICDMYNLSHDANSKLFAEYLPVLVRILDRIRETGNSVIQSFLGHTLNTALDANNASDSLANRKAPSDQERERRRLILSKKREKQAAALAQMQRAQARFAEHIGANVSETQTPSSALRPGNSTQSTRGHHMLPGEDASLAPTDRLDAGNRGLLQQTEDAQLPECALCHETGRGDGTRLMGLIGFHQTTRLPAIALSQCNSGTQFDEKVRRDNLAEASNDSVHRQRGEGENTGDVDMDATSSERYSSLQNSQLRQSFFLSPEMLRHGVESCENLHISFCGHSIHIECFDRYFSILTQSKARHSLYEGANVLDLDKLEFLCPVCRRLANMVLPIMNDVSEKGQATVSRSTRSSNSPLPFDEWVELCDLEVKNGLNREGSALQSRLRTNDENGEDEGQGIEYQKGEIASKVHALRVSIINSGKAVLQKFGLQSLRSASTYGRTAAGDMDKDIPSTRSYAKLPSAAIATVACAEIAARGGCWYDSASQLARRSLRIAIIEARAQVSLEPEARRQGLRLLWEAARSPEASKRLDPFATFAFLFLLWGDDLKLHEARNLVRVGFNLICNQGFNCEGISDNAQVAVNLKILLYLRRACLMVSSCFALSSIGLIETYHVSNGSISDDTVRREIQHLLSHFGIPTLPEMSKRVPVYDFSEVNRKPLTLSFRQERVGLIKLPQLFQSLLEDLDGKRCASCKANPKYPALCLVCGDLFCAKECQSTQHWLEAHPKICGAGIGVFLVLKATKVQIIRNKRASLWGSPYLDAHGEEDEDLGRGKPLFLNKERYSTLECLWLTHGFDQDSRILSTTIPVHREPEVSTIFF